MRQRRNQPIYYNYISSIKFFIKKNSDVDFKSLLFGADNPEDNKILSLKKAIDLYGDKIKNFFVIWTINSVLQTIQVKKAFQNSEYAPKNAFSSFLLGLRNRIHEPHPKPWMSELIDLSWYFYVSFL